MKFYKISKLIHIALLFNCLNDNNNFICQRQIKICVLSNIFVNGVFSFRSSENIVRKRAHTQIAHEINIFLFACTTDKK